MSTFNTRPAENLGGMQWVKIAAAQWISSITYSYNYSPAAVSFTGSYGWMDLYCTLETIKFSQTEILSPSASGWHQELKCFLPGKLGALDLDLEAMPFQRWIVAVNDWEDKVTVIGSKENPCFLKIAFDSMDKVAGLKGHLFNFFRDDAHRTREIAKAVLF